ncbi:hypothetical protein [Parasphingopyxis marina]|uniref:Uncharacterized protein n=1 Tax=Parasphingopyxis marina TaxID=2761622 RepID=A0A842I3G5_9SPHN|nr:hypothetical protein [Parasphingopyxis marina]MBC2778940.1 hypothetical protein [Parasphingopyxis marina]
MAERIEFASDAWLEKLCELLEKYTALAGPELELSICEVFTGVPKHLDKNGNGVIAWHCHIVGGEVVFEDGEIESADLKTVADYDFVLPLARLTIDDTTQEEYLRLQKLGAETGKLSGSGDKSKVPQSFYAMHNEMAEMTA